jgi:hypothetical protein
MWLSGIDFDGEFVGRDIDTKNVISFVAAKASCGGRINFLHDAEQGAAWILQHDEVRSRMISPGIPSRPQIDETLDLLVLIFRIEIEMNPAPASWTRVATLE